MRKEVKNSSVAALLGGMNLMLIIIRLPASRNAWKAVGWMNIALSAILPTLQTRY